MLPDVLADERSESRGGGEGDRRLQFDELGPVGMRSSRRSGLLERARYDPLGPDGGDRDLLRIGDLTRVVRSRSYGDLDLRLSLSATFSAIQHTICQTYTYRLLVI